MGLSFIVSAASFKALADFISPSAAITLARASLFLNFFLMELCSSLLCSYSPCCLSFGCHGPLQLCRQTNIFAVERTELIYTLLTSKTISICLLRNLFKANKFSSQFFSKSRTSFSLSERHHSRAAFQAKVNWKNFSRAATLLHFNPLHFHSPRIGSFV